MGISTRTIAFFDANSHGHHPTYQRLVVNMMLEKGFRVWLLTNGAEDMRERICSMHHGKLPDGLMVLPVRAVPPGGVVLRRFWGLRNWRYAGRCISQLHSSLGYGPDLIVFLKIDDYTNGILTGNWIDRTFPYQWTGFYIHLRFPKRLPLTFFRKRCYQPFSAFLSKRCQSVATLQENITRQFGQIIAKPVHTLPDMTDEAPPIESALTAKIKAKAGERKVIGLIGGQDRRKGSFLFLEIARRCQDRNWLFLFCGKMNYEKSDRELEQLKDIIGDESTWNNCFFHFEHIPDERHFNAVIDICDVLFAVYQNFPFSSNIMTKAALFRKPIVVGAGGLMAQRVKSFDLGTCCTPEDTDNCIWAIEAALERTVSGSSYAKYFSLHSQKRFRTKFFSLIEDGLHHEQRQIKQ